MYNGIVLHNEQEGASTDTHPVRMYKIGEPTDSLVSFVLKKDD